MKYDVFSIMQRVYYIYIYTHRIPYALIGRSYALPIIPLAAVSTAWQKDSSRTMQRICRPILPQGPKNPEPFRVRYLVGASSMPYVTYLLDTWIHGLRDGRTWPAPSTCSFAKQDPVGWLFLCDAALLGSEQESQA